MPEVMRLPSDIGIALKIAHLLARAEHTLGFYSSALDRLPLQARLEAILSGAMENPSAVDEATYSLAYALSRQSQANVGNEKLKQQPAGPMHQPKQEPKKQQ